MSTEKYQSLKELTPAQEAKCDKIIELLSELKRCGVHPLIIDGGGGSGLQFILSVSWKLHPLGWRGNETKSF